VCVDVCAGSQAPGVCASVTPSCQLNHCGSYWSDQSKVHTIAHIVLQLKFVVPLPCCCSQAKRIQVRTPPAQGGQEPLPFYHRSNEWLLDTEGVNLMEVGEAVGALWSGEKPA
jgi:hypothetical protein